MAYGNITGHGPIKEYLKKALGKGALSHAYLFEGRSGVGKSAMAKEFAKALNCERSDAEACDECISCRKADLGNHPDIIAIGPDGRSIKNEQVKKLQTEMHLKPYESVRKVFIIESAETMTPQAQNSLLKVLEEPPASCLIILVSANREGLLPTVRSRCQRIHFERIGKESLVESLVGRSGITRDEVISAAGMADGSLRMAESLAGDASFAGMREGSLKLLEDCLAGNIKAVLVKTESVSRLERPEVLKFLDSAVAWCRDLSVYKETNNEHFVVNNDKMEKIRDLTRMTDGKALYKVLDALMEAVELMAGTANQQMVVDHLILKIQEALR